MLVEFRFRVTMPNVGSGKWTGSEYLHSVIRTLDKSDAIEIINKSFYYDFGDGWVQMYMLIKYIAKLQIKYENLQKDFVDMNGGLNPLSAINV
jgi:hypothetical protein